MQGPKGKRAGGNPARIAEYEAILRRQPGSKFFAALAEEHIKTGSYKEALKVCRKGLIHNPGFAKGQMMLVKALYFQGKYTDARAELERLMGDHPGDGEPLVLWGELLLSTKDAQKAVDCFQKALKINPNNRRAKKLLAEAESLSDDVGEATLPASDLSGSPWKEDTERFGKETSKGPGLRKPASKRGGLARRGGEGVWGDETMPLRSTRAEGDSYNAEVRTEEIEEVEMVEEEGVEVLEEDDDDDALIGVPQHAVLPKDREPSRFKPEVMSDLLNLQEMLADDPGKYKDDGIKTQRMIVKSLRLPSLDDGPPEAGAPTERYDGLDPAPGGFPQAPGPFGWFTNLSSRDRLVVILTAVAIFMAILTLVLYLITRSGDESTVETSSYCNALAMSPATERTMGDSCPSWETLLRNPKA